MTALALFEQGRARIKRERAKEGLASARRGNGGRHSGRAVADRDGLGLLRPGRRMSGGVCGAARAGVDGRADALVLNSSRTWLRSRAGAWFTGPSLMQLQGARPDALEVGAAGVRASRAGDEPALGRLCLLPAGGDSPPTGRVRGGRECLSRRRASTGRSRSRAWRCCGWRRETQMPRAPRSGATLGEASERRSARDCFLPL